MRQLLTVEKIIQETASAKTIVFKPTPGIKYQAGQFLTFIFNTIKGEERRNYSLSSAPGIDKAPAITVKRIDNGAFSRVLTDQLQPGDQLTTIGASGFFTLPADIKPQQKFVFFAAGSGITPVYSLIKALLLQQQGSSIILVYSNHSAASTIFYNQLQQLEKDFASRFKIEFLFSNNPDLYRARLNKLLIADLLKKYEPVAAQALFYLCGPFDYMRMVTIELLQEGVPENQLRKENFIIFEPDIKLLPPDLSARTVTILSQNAINTIRVQYPDTILLAAKKNGIELPYSCEAGKCGTCAANCISGTVWMRYNEVLLDEDIAAGKVLTCTGYPINGDVTIAYT